MPSNASISGYLELATSTYKQAIQNIDPGVSDIQCNFGSPPSGYLWHIERIACITSDSSAATWTVYVGSDLASATDESNIADAFGPSPRGCFVEDPYIRVRDTEYLVVRAEGFTASATVAVSVQGLQVKAVTAPIPAEPMLIGISS